ncbi:hypothetical protein [Paraburkholderia tropica]|nr:hypothetical protein [Paraburkholderia tropica]
MTSSLAFMALAIGYGVLIAPLVDMKSPRYWLLLLVPSVAYLIGCAA